PQQQSMCAGSSGTFSVSATGAQTYQWRKDGAPLGGATGPSLVINPVGTGNAGVYDCVVTNSCGSTPSSGAALVVSTGVPIVTISPQPANVCVGGTANFTVSATGALTFQWRKNTINIPGATASAYSIVGVVAGDAGSYDCVVTNGCGSATSAAAALVVSTGIPNITIAPASQSVCAGGSVAFSVVATGAA